MELTRMIFDRVHEKVETECEARGGVKTKGAKMLLDLIDACYGEGVLTRALFFFHT